MRIGLFDSGIGGFTVLKKVIELCPNNSFIYLADTARLPYGIKTFNAVFKGKLNSTIFLTRSNITPTDTETTVKAEIEKIKGGINCERIHLSSRGI